MNTKKAALAHIIAGKLRSLRENKRWTQQQVAQLLRIDRSAYAYYETAKTFPSLVLLVDIADLYGVSTDYLLGREKKQA